ncbi:MAG: lipoprotein [Gammaproteobacteria bacterium]|jgi:hypothetical protein
MILKPISRLPTAFLAVLMLTGCGQKGPLYLPDETAGFNGGLETTAIRAIPVPPGSQPE